MSNSVGGAIAEGIQGGWQMGRQASLDAQHRLEFEAEQHDRDLAQARLAKQEEDRYGRLQDTARLQALESRLATLQKLSDAAVAAGHQPPATVLQERAQLSVQLEDMQQQIQTTGRLAPGGGVATATQSLPSPQGIVPNAATGTAPPASTPPAAGVAAATSQPAPQSAVAPGMAGLQNAPAPAMPGAAPPAAAVSSPTSSAVTPAQKAVADTDQQSQDLASRLSTGQISLSDVKPGDFALMVASATKRPPGELDQVRQHIADWHSGMTTGNNGLMLQGLNGVFGPQINQGVGTPSGYGGTITGKSVIGLDPAMSADGTIHTDKVIPRLQVTTDVKGPDGQPLSYHAPMTQSRSSDPNDPVTAVPMADAVNHIGALGALVESASHPDAQKLLAEGSKDPRVQQYLDAYTAAATPANPALVKENQIQAYMKATGLNRDDATQRMIDMGVLPRPPMTKGVVAQTMDAAYQMVADGSAPDVQSALSMLQRGGVTKQPSKYSPGAVHTGGGTGTGVAAAIGTPGLTGDDYLKTLPASMQATVKNIAENPELLKNVPTTKGQRLAVQNAVLQYKPDASLGASGGTGLGSRESIYTSRVLNSMHEALADAQNVMELPLSSSTGLLNLGTPKTLMSAGRQYLANKVSDDDVQGYNVLSSGFARSLATIETAGLAPGQNFTDSLGKLQLAPGDTELTKMRKMAQTRQIVEAGMQSVLNNPRIPKEQKAEATTAIAQLRQAIPFTQHDLTTMQSKWNDDPNTTMSDVVGKHMPPAAAPAAAPAIVKPGGKLVYNPATGGFN